MKAKEEKIINTIDEVSLKIEQINNMTIELNKICQQCSYLLDLLRKEQLQNYHLYQPEQNSYLFNPATLSLGTYIDTMESFSGIAKAPDVNYR